MATREQVEKTTKTPVVVRVRLTNGGRVMPAYRLAGGNGYELLGDGCMGQIVSASDAKEV